MILEISEHLKDYLTEVAERVIWNLLEYESQTNPFEKEENQKPDLSFSLKMVSKLIQVIFFPPFFILVLGKFLFLYRYFFLKKTKQQKGFYVFNGNII